jgi:hypothetical protein
MANDPPPPPPPPQQFFSAKNEQMGALIQREISDDVVHCIELKRLSDSEGLFTSFERLSDNEALFIQCMSDAARRRIAFNVVERNCRAAFARGEEGLALFMKVRGLVERAHVEEAVRQFDKRFAPMLDPQLRR